MAENRPQSAVAEVAHILFIDMVGYSLLTLPDQIGFQEQLSALLCSTRAFQRAQSGGDLVCLPTGDGVALAFFRNALSPIACAIELSHLLNNETTLRVRMGIHSGLVYRITDINGNQNIFGEGINNAQRVMDCGDARHILLSAHVVEMLHQLGNWAEHLCDFGECGVKHGKIVHVFSLVKEGIGNSELPDKIQTYRQTVLPPPPAEPIAPDLSPAPIAPLLAPELRTPDRATPTATRPRRFLLIPGREGTGVPFVLEEGTTAVVGRAPDAGIRLSDERVSHHHCQIELTPSALVAKDLKSKNGTFVNGVKISRCELKAGDSLQLGRTQLRVQIMDEATPDTNHAGQ